MKRYWIYVIGMVMSPLAHSYIYQIKVLRMPNADYTSYRYVIGLSDFHDKANTVNESQSKYVEQMLCAAHDKHNSTLVLTEDLSSRGAGGRGSCGNFYVNSRGGMLGGLAQRCQQLGVPVKNMEYRYCRVSALGPVLNNMHDEPHTFASVKSITVASLSKEVDVIAHEVASYDDGAVLKKLYKEHIDRITSQGKKYRHADNDGMSVADFLKKSSKTPAKRLEFLKDWLTFDSGLLDIKIVHAVVNAQEKIVFVIAGGAHIARMTTMLEKVGYQKVYESEGGYAKEYDLQRCLGSPIIDGSFCVRPNPIELNVLDQYL